LEIEGDSYEKIKKMAISSGVSDFMFLLSVHYILLSKMTGETDIIIGTDAMGRGNLDLQDMVGTFVNVLPLRVEVVPEMMFIDFLMSVKECVLGAFDHQDFQYDQLISMLNEQQALQRNLFDVHFSFSNVLDKPADEADWKIVPFELDTRASAHYEITIEVKEKKEQFEMLFVFSEALYEEETIEALMTYYHQILDQVMASHDITIENITI
jgi:non-ribosomal peptide synthetase component F